MLDQYGGRTASEKAFGTAALDQHGSSTELEQVHGAVLDQNRSRTAWKSVQEDEKAWKHLAIQHEDKTAADSAAKQRLGGQSP